MSKHTEKLQKLLHSKNTENVEQGLFLSDSLALSPQERSVILDFSNRRIHLTLNN